MEWHQATGALLEPDGTRIRLEILLDETNQQSLGNVTKNEASVEASYVLLLQWPRTGQPRTISGDAGGQFQFVRLVPGEYSVLAVAAEDAKSIHDPDVLERALMRAKIYFTPNAGAIIPTRTGGIEVTVIDCLFRPGNVILLAPASTVQVGSPRSGLRTLKRGLEVAKCPSAVDGVEQFLANALLLHRV